MAKKSSIEKDKHRRKLVAQYAAKRARLLAVANDDAQPQEERFAARLKLAELPRSSRKLVTSHDAFQYFARDYGFTIYAIEGFSHADQPSSAKVARIIAAIRAQGVKAVFPESIENPKVLREITRESGAKIGPELYADGLGEGDARTYAGMFRHNVTAIVDALK